MPDGSAFSSIALSRLPRFTQPRREHTTGLWEGKEEEREERRGGEGEKEEVTDSSTFRSASLSSLAGTSFLL